MAHSRIGYPATRQPVQAGKGKKVGDACHGGVEGGQPSQATLLLLLLLLQTLSQTRALSSSAQPLDSLCRWARGRRLVMYIMGNLKGGQPSQATLLLRTRALSCDAQPLGSLCRQA
eukprot:1156664-Pelagomonas_calceolata.AAC.2